MVTPVVAFCVSLTAVAVVCSALLMIVKINRRTNRMLQAADQTRGKIREVSQMSPGRWEDIKDTVMRSRGPDDQPAEVWRNMLVDCVLEINRWGV